MSLDDILECIREDFANNNVDEVVRELEFEEDLKQLGDIRNFGSDWDEDE
jgi:hypothetical protein